MATMPPMRQFTKTHRLQALSIPEITEELEQLVLTYGRSIRFRGRTKLKLSHAINAAVVLLLEAPEPTRQEAFRRALNRLESLMAEDVEDSPDQSSPPAPGEPLLAPAEGPSRRKRKA
jgi:hypothetical protein